MINISCSKEQLLKLISETVNDLMEQNRDDFDKKNQLMTPLSSQISVLATIQVLQSLGFITINESKKCF